MAETVKIDRHLYITEDGSRVVEEGDPAGRWLWAAPGQDVPRAEAERLGAVAPEPAPEPVQPSRESKAAPASRNKIRRRGEDK